MHKPQLPRRCVFRSFLCEQSLQDDVQALLATAQQYRKQAVEFGGEIEEFQRISTSLLRISTVGRLLEECERCVRSAKITKASQLLQDIAEQVPANTTEGIMKDLHRDARKVRATFESRLKTFLHLCVSIKVCCLTAVVLAYTCCC
jgi:hypothetical protein